MPQVTTSPVSSGTQIITQKSYIKVSVAPVQLKTGEYGYVMSSRDRGTPTTIDKQGLSLSFRMVKKPKYNPNAPKNESGFEFEAWLFNEFETAEEKRQAFEAMATIFASELGDSELVYLYMNPLDYNDCITEEEFNQLPS